MSEPSVEQKNKSPSLNPDQILLENLWDSWYVKLKVSYMYLPNENKNLKERLCSIRTIMTKHLLQIDPSKINNDWRYTYVMDFIEELGDYIGIEVTYNYNTLDEALIGEIERNESLKKQKKHYTFKMFLTQFYVRMNIFCKLKFPDGKFSDNPNFKKLWHAIKHNIRIVEEEGNKYQNRYNEYTAAINSVNELCASLGQPKFHPNTQFGI